MEYLIGASVQAEYPNDDLLGRVLDSIHDYGADSFYNHLSVQAVSRLGFTVKQVTLIPAVSMWMESTSETSPDEDSSPIATYSAYCGIFSHSPSFSADW